MLWFIIIALALFQYEREKTYRTQRVNDELRLINSRIIASYDQDIDLAPFMNFIAKYYENSVLNGIRVSIYDERGELLYCVGTPIPRYTSENLPPELADATEKGAGTAFRRSDETTRTTPTITSEPAQVPTARYMCIRQCPTLYRSPSQWPSTRACG